MRETLWKYSPGWSQSISTLYFNNTSKYHQNAYVLKWGTALHKPEGTPEMASFLLNISTFYILSVFEWIILKTHKHKIRYHRWHYKNLEKIMYDKSVVFWLKWTILRDAILFGDLYWSQCLISQSAYSAIKSPHKTSHWAVNQSPSTVSRQQIKGPIDPRWCLVRGHYLPGYVQTNFLHTLAVLVCQIINYTLIELISICTYWCKS